MSGLWGVSRRNRRSSAAVPRQQDSAWIDDLSFDRSRPEAPGHRWLVGGQSAVTSWLSTTAPRTLGDLPGHPRLRGPFTAAGTLVRSLAPDLLGNHPALVRSHGGDVLAAAPELAWLLGPARPSGHHQHDHARHVAEGLAALTLAYAQARGPRQRLAVFDVDALDATDAMWLAALVTQADPGRLEIVFAGATASVPAPLASALAGRAVRTDVATPRVRKALGAPPSDRILARAFVASDCLSDDPTLGAAYLALDGPDRAGLHDIRAARLELLGEPSLRLGAIPFHRERGSVPGAGVAALTHAITECFRAGWYTAALEFGDRLRALLGPDGGKYAMPAGA